MGYNLKLEVSKKKLLLENMLLLEIKIIVDAVVNYALIKDRDPCQRFQKR